jgi:hypothetical protein
MVYVNLDCMYTKELKYLLKLVMGENQSGNVMYAKIKEFQLQYLPQPSLTPSLPHSLTPSLPHSLRPFIQEIQKISPKIQKRA